MNEKTKLGLSAAFFAAGLYAVGFFGLTPLLLMAGYTLLMEESDFLKRAAVKSLTIVLAFEVVDLVVSLFSSVLGLISWIISLFGSFSFSGLINFVESGASILELACVIICILAAVKGKEAKLPVIDGFVDKIMGVVPSFNQPAPQPVQQPVNQQFAQQPAYQQQTPMGQPFPQTPVQPEQNAYGGYQVPNQEQTPQQPLY